jgi:hypothetical protein
MTEDRAPWAVDGGCVLCGFSHRFQWPSGSDASGHKGDTVACVNSLVPALADALGERDALLTAIKEADAILAGWWSYHEPGREGFKGTHPHNASEVLRAALATHPKATDEGTNTHGPCSYPGCNGHGTHDEA